MLGFREKMADPWVSSTHAVITVPVTDAEVNDSI